MPMLKTLRTRFDALREKVGTAGMVVSVIALVLATTGAAFATKSALTPKQKREVVKIAKKYAGRPGLAGPTGPTGANGKDGAAGTIGTNGENVTVKSYTGPECSGEGEEGAKLSNGTGTAYACNGKEGSPWTVGGKLPSGKTLTGMWGDRGEGKKLVPISYGLNVGNVPTLNFLNAVENPSTEEFETETTVQCPGKSGNTPGTKVMFGNGDVPVAEPGNLCIYDKFKFGTITFESGNSQSTTNGAILPFSFLGGENAVTYGLWAVTAGP